MRNRIADNVLMDRYRLEVSGGVKDANKSIATNNYLVGVHRPCVVKNNITGNPDTKIEKPTKRNKYKLKVSKKQYNKIKGTSHWNDLKYFIRK